MFIVGQSIKGGSYLEHAVLRVMLCHESHAMFTKGASVEDVSDFLLRHLRVVRITSEGGRHVDHVLRLKTRMPEGWTFGSGDPFARLTAAGIVWKPIGQTNEAADQEP